MSDLQPVKIEEAKKIATSIDLRDSQAVVQYGIATQVKISDFSDSVLQEIRNKDSGHVGEALTDLMTRIREVDAGSLGQQKSVLGRLFSNIKNQIARFMSRFEKLTGQIDQIVNKLETSRMSLIKDITMLDKLYEKNLEHLQELDLYIEAGKLKLEEVRTSMLPEFEKKAAETNDPLDAQRLQDLNNAINRFEKKLHDMQLTRMLAIQTGPQVRLIQQNNQSLVEKIQSSILTTIPLWKNQIVIAISLFRQKGALELQRQVSDMTNQMLNKNSEMLKQGSIEIAKESERGIVEIETLQKVNTDLISTIEETLKIQKEGREKRLSAEVELKRLEDDLKTRLRSTTPTG